VTEHFGTVALGSAHVSRLPGSETVMRMLERTFRVSTRYGGGFVQSIDGLAGGSQRDWFYYVNGVQASEGAATTPLHQGDHVWWDFHDWRAAESIPAVVGAFPEPFVHGIEGRRYPTVLDCARDAGTACARSAAALTRAGVHFQEHPRAGSASSLIILVGPWTDPALASVRALVDRGPPVSGVYARFASAGNELQLLDPTGRVLRTLRHDAGLIAATATPSGTPIWMITGTDAAGGAAAAAALDPRRLSDRFAVAVQGGDLLGLPLEAGA
jgi:hypothetical protein